MRGDFGGVRGDRRWSRYVWNWLCKDCQHRSSQEIRNCQHTFPGLFPVGSRLALALPQLLIVENSRKQVPVLYDGDMHQHDKVITWLTSQDVFEIKTKSKKLTGKCLTNCLKRMSSYRCSSVSAMKLILSKLGLQSLCSLLRWTQPTGQHCSVGKARKHRQRDR